MYKFFWSINLHSINHLSERMAGLRICINEFIELDLKYLEKVMPYIYQLWGRPVHLESVMEKKGILFSYDGKSIHRKYL